MKKLNRIRLINWQGFFDETIDIAGSALIVGENGSGKSSLLDALYFVLSGGNAKSFNSAASSRSKRSLETYIRGRTGDLKKPNLRDETPLISHICLQFHDDVNSEDFCIGVVLELSSSDQLTKNFYRLKSTFPGDMFEDKDEDGVIVLNYPSMVRKLKKVHNIEIDSLGSTSRDFKKQLKEIISLEDEKYYELLPKAMAFQPIDDINDFAYQFLIPARTVNIQRMRENLETYNLIRKQIESDRAMKAALEPIVKQGEKYREARRNEKLLNAQMHRVSIIEWKEAIQRNKEKIKSDQTQIETLSRRKDSLERSLKITQKSIFEIEHGESYQRLTEVEKLLAEAEEKRNYWQREVADLEKDIKNEQEVIDALDLGIDLREPLEKRDFPLLETRITKEGCALEDKRDLLSYELNSLIAESEKLSNESERTNVVLDKLRKGIQSYPSYVENLIEKITESIPDAKPMPLCELIEDIEDEGWRDALEGYLGDRRFDLFIKDSLFAQVASLYEDLKANGDIHGVGLVDAARLEETQSIECAEDSLATKVICRKDDLAVNRYVNQLLGGVQCVDRIDESTNVERAITKEAYIYEDKALRKISENSYSIPYIGSKSLELRKVQLERRMIELESSYRTNASKRSEVTLLINKVRSSSNAKLSIAKDAWAEYENYDKETERLQGELEELRKSDMLIQELEEHRREEKKLTEEKDFCVSESRSLQDEINSIPGTNADLQQKIQERERKLAQIIDIDLTDEKMEAFMRENPCDPATIKSRLSQIGDEIKTLENFITQRMASYIGCFPAADLLPQIESLNDFFKLYNQIVKRNLEQFSRAEEQAKREVIDNFNNDYLKKMHSYIAEAKERVDDLNSVLRKRPFGAVGDIYKFDIARSKDRELGEIYDVFTSDEDFDLQEFGFSSKHQRVIDNLLKRLTSQVNESDEDFYRRVSNYLDYRKFMSYDIIIQNSEGKSYRFSEISREKSGGETQTPFYVIIAASFDQLFSSKNSESSKGCIVLLDEAFEKMDEAHIESMMEYFRELSIQPFIAVPTQHGRTIIPYVDTSIGLTKIHDRIIPSTISKEL